MKKIVYIVGATSVGKTSLSIDIAKKFNGEVVSADSRQIFKGVDALSGKILSKDMEGIPHHMIDIVDAGRDYSVKDFASKGTQSIENILEKEKLPIIAGGSGYYIQSLLYQNSFAEGNVDTSLRERLEALSTEELFIELQSKDKIFAEKVDKHNRRRLIRAIELVNIYGRVPPLSMSKKFDSIGIGLQLPKETLHTLIDERLNKRFSNMKKEIEYLYKKGVSIEWMKNSGLELKWMAHLLEGAEDKDVIANLSKEIKQYSKRQLTWFKKDKNTTWFSPEDRNDIFTHIQKHLVQL